MGAILSIINPGQFTVGISCIETIGRTADDIGKSSDLHELLEVWASPYNVMSVMNNRDSPIHCNNGGAYTSMDLLTL